MIAQRFRALGWVASCAAAATGLYLVSLQVAAERARLEAIDQSIADTQRDMRRLQTELGTRASLRQLEKWNEATLSLKTPRAGQFIRADYRLSSLADRVNALPRPRHDVVLASVEAAPALPVALRHAAYVTSDAPVPQSGGRDVVSKRLLRDLTRNARAEAKSNR